jgi:hypothetical protein
MSNLSTLSIYPHKNIKILKIFFFLTIYFLLSATGKIDKENCNFDLFEYQNEIKNISNIKSIEVKNKNYRKWTIEGMRIYLNSFKKYGFIDKKYKKFHKADIKIKYEFGNCRFKAKIRQNGDLFDHIKFENSNFRRSLDVKILNGNIGGITKFKLFNPESREGDNEIFMTELLRELNILAPITHNVYVSVNGVENQYIFQEKIVKEFLENNLRRENPIFEGSEEFIWNSKTNNYWEHLSLINLDNPNFIKNDYDKLELVLRSYKKLQDVYLDYVTNIFEINGETIVLNIEKLSNDSSVLFQKWIKFELLMIASNSGHGLRPHNRKFFWNSLDGGFEPIYYDGTPLLNNINILYTDNYVFEYLSKFVKLKDIEDLKKHIAKVNNLNFYKKLKSGGVNLSREEVEIIFKKLLNRLDNINQNLKNSKNFQETKLDVSDIKKYKNILKNYNFELYTNTILKIDREDDFILTEECTIDCSFEKRKITYIHKLLNNKKLSNSNIIFIDNKLNQEINKKNINLNSNNLNIYYTGKPKIEIINNKIIKFTQLNSEDWIMIKDSNINDITIIFKGAKNFKNNTGLNNNNITNCLSFYNVNFENTNLEAANNYCEDAINIISSKGKLKKIEIKNSLFDALDIDFSDIKIETLNIENAGNDCVDFSHGKYYTASINAFECGDKAISVGENSLLNIDNLKINYANFGVASKDSSITKIQNSMIDNTNICLAAYNKKQEFNGGYLEINNNNCINYKNYKMVDHLSRVVIN